MKIIDLKALEVLDSRGNPTVLAKVFLDNGSEGKALVPSGASTGSYEAIELRDDDQSRYIGRGVSQAVRNIIEKIRPILIGQDPEQQIIVDELMIKLDGTPNKANLGANAILAVSLATAQAAANGLRQPLYKYLTKFNPDFLGRYIMPIPMFNVLNGGQHADWATDIQEYMVLPIRAGSIKNAVRQGAEIYQNLRKVLKSKGYSISVGDEGGFAPAVSSNEEPFVLLSAAIKNAGYSLGQDVVLGIDAAATEFFHNGIYSLKKENKVLSGGELSSFYQNLQSRYPIYSWEDVFSEDDWVSFQAFTAQQNNHAQVIGDDLYVTSISRLDRGIKEKATNSILIKLNQVGTLSETIQAVLTARQAGLTAVISHRSGETEDTFIADLVVALGTGQIKTGAPARSDRTAKYNRLIEIEAELGDQAEYAQFPFKK